MQELNGAARRGFLERRDRELAAYREYRGRAGARLVPVAGGRGDGFFEALRVLAGGHLVAWGRARELGWAGAAPSVAQLREALAGAVEDSFAGYRAGLAAGGGAGAGLLAELAGGEGAQRQLAAWIRAQGGWEGHQGATVARAAAGLWQLPLTVLGPDYPWEAGPESGYQRGYLVQDGPDLRGVRADPGFPVLRAAQLLPQPQVPAVVVPDGTSLAELAGQFAEVFGEAQAAAFDAAVQAGDYDRALELTGLHPGFAEAVAAVRAAAAAGDEAGLAAGVGQMSILHARLSQLAGPDDAGAGAGADQAQDEADAKGAEDEADEEQEAAAEQEDEEEQVEEVEGVVVSAGVVGGMAAAAEWREARGEGGVVPAWLYRLLGDRLRAAGGGGVRVRSGAGQADAAAGLAAVLGVAGEVPRAGEWPAGLDEWVGVGLGALGGVEAPLAAGWAVALPGVAGGDLRERQLLELGGVAGGRAGELPGELPGGAGPVFVLRGVPAVRVAGLAGVADGAVVFLPGTWVQVTGVDRDGPAGRLQVTLEVTAEAEQVMAQERPAQCAALVAQWRADAAQVPPGRAGGISAGPAGERFVGPRAGPAAGLGGG